MRFGKYRIANINIFFLVAQVVPSGVEKRNYQQATWERISFVIRMIYLSETGGLGTYRSRWLALCSVKNVLLMCAWAKKFTNRFFFYISFRLNHWFKCYIVLNFHQCYAVWHIKTLILFLLIKNLNVTRWLFYGLWIYILRDFLFYRCLFI